MSLRVDSSIHFCIICGSNRVVHSKGICSKCTTRHDLAEDVD